MNLTGNSIVVRLDNNALMYSTDVSMEVTNSLVEVTTRRTGPFKEFISGVKSHSISFSGLIGLDNLNELWVKNGMEITFRFDAGTNQRYEGKGYLNSVSIQGGVDDAISYSGSIEGIEELRLLQASTEELTICFGSQTLCFNSETISGPRRIFVT